MSKKVLIMSMGKAGSTTVINALKSAGVDYGRIHWNNRNEVDTSQYDYFIAMAREPVARAISHYFEYGREEATSEHEITAYIKKEIAFTLAFFDELVKPVTGIDIYAPIACMFHKWWQIYQNNTLVIKTENLTNGFVTAMFALTGIYPYEVAHHPKGSERFGHKYDEFRANFKLPHDYLETVANSKYCQHFNYYDAVMAWSE